MNILISGAGIAGPALAYWLRHYGFTPTVVERASAPRQGGQAVDLRGSAREVVERMGLLEQIRAHHTGVAGLAAVDRDNRRLWSWDAEISGDSGGIIAEIEILRGDLARIFYEATRENVEYVFGESITELNQHEGGVEVTFAGGASRSFDLVVGADGLHSRVRRLAFGPESEFLRDQGYYKVVFAVPSATGLGDWQVMHTMPGGKRAGLYPVRNGPARGMLFFLSPPVNHDRQNFVHQKKIVAEAFAGQGWQVPLLLEAMWEAADFYFDREALVSVQGWARDRAVLLGDSAFGGSIGMGTSMAVVGAYVLAGELAAADGNHRKAFASYEARLREYVKVNQKPMPGGTKSFLPRTRHGIWLGNHLTRAMLAGPWRRMLTGGLQDKSNSITLKKYVNGALTVDGQW